MGARKLIFILGFLLLHVRFAVAESTLGINIIVPQVLLDTSITAITVVDFKNLLQDACNCKVTVNGKTTKVNIFLPFVTDSMAAAPTRFSQAATFPYKHVPAHQYEWQHAIDRKGRYQLMLNASSFQGVSFGMYGLLQEKLDFKFLHPRQTIVPHFKEWPLKEAFVWKAEPLFDKKGFHLHTQHPLELTEQLHNGNMPNALNDVKAYIDWLARNGQNYFEFCLLRSVNKKEWIPHATAITNYVHQRGLLAAVDVSLHMIQQKTFQLYGSSVNKKKQIAANLEWLNQAKWDFINMEFSTAEFIGGNKKKKEQLRQYILEWLQNNSTTKLMGRQHVVKHENELGSKKHTANTTVVTDIDKQRGVLAHTVMFYTMSEEKAPVYENENLRHILSFMLEEHKQRETWYYPESAYWITFDNSVPMLLLPYLQARLADIDTCVHYNIPGHITFSSGWEWGYWLVDWSIAQWSWKHTTNGKLQERAATMYAHRLTDSAIHTIFDSTLQLQQQYLKDSTLMQWLTAMTITDEIAIKKVANEYHPRPDWSYKYIRNKASLAQIEQLKATVVPQLRSFAEKGLQLAMAARRKQPAMLDTANLNAEIIDGLEITAWRAYHRYYTLQYIMAKRMAAITKEKFAADSLLLQAAAIRNHCMQLVDNRERKYRYSTDLIARKRWDYTAYHFGYLYPVSNLHFWNREEQQAKKNQYRPLFMNIWNIARIIGLVK
ncbi:MAG: hypothetical protein U0T72_09520 [Chitinophagales bacterium]